MSKRLKILQNSLAKKQAKMDRLIANHFTDVKSANGQPLNDKRNGTATFKRWERQNEAIRNIKDGIKNTERAIEKEKSKISKVESMQDKLPDILASLLRDGVITQWRRHPNTFFVKGVENARLHFDLNTKLISHKYVKEISDKEQYTIFRDVFNRINNEYNKNLA